MSSPTSPPPAADAPRPAAAVAPPLPFHAEWWQPIRKTSPEFWTAFRKARSGVTAMETSGHNKHDDYRYSSMKDFVDAIESGLSENGINVVVETVTPRWFSSQSLRGNPMTGCHVIIRGHVTHDATDGSLPFQFAGEARDMSDKSLYKSITGARKYALSCLFNLKGGTDPEADSPVEHGDDHRRPAPQQQNNRGGQRRSDPKSPPAGAAAAPADPPAKKPTVVEKIRACKNGGELASQLAHCIGKFPIAENRTAWEKFIPAAEETMHPWNEANQAVVSAVLLGVKAQLAGSPTATAAPAAAPHDAGPPPSIESIAQWIEDQKTPADLLVLLETLHTSPRCQSIRNHPQRFFETVDHAKLVVEKALHDQAWTVEECDGLMTKLGVLDAVVNTAQQSKEAFQGG